MARKMLDRYRPHERVHPETGPGRTKQSFAEESNINIIMRRYEKTGVLDHFNRHQGDYGNFLNAPDYHTALNGIRAAETAFMELPAGVRSKFQNNPAAFLDFVQNPDNLEEMVEMGLAKPLEADPDAVANDDPPPPPEEPALPLGDG